MGSGFVRSKKKFAFPLAVFVLALTALYGLFAAPRNASAQAGNELEGRAVLNAMTFAPGPTSGRRITGNTNGQVVPFINKQPVQGFSAVLNNDDGTFHAMADNGFGSLENSADFNLRVYHIRPEFKTKNGGSGNISVLGYIELRDPDKKIPFAITNHFTTKRILTGADFDIESMQRTADGTLWFGDEFGPFILHTDATGRVLDEPFPLPDFDRGGEVRSPQNPFHEEASAVRIMNAVQMHARRYGNKKVPVFSPSETMLDDADANTFVGSRQNPPANFGHPPASSAIFNVQSIKNAGFPVVPYTVNDKARMLELMKLGVNGLISDRPDLLFQAVSEFDANGDGTPGDYLAADGLIDPNKFDAQGHRGGRNLRPENTLPAMEAALDNLMTTLETDNGVTADNVPVLSHDPHVQAQKCRRADGAPYGPADEVLIRGLTAAELQATFICDKLFRGPEQKNDYGLSPVAVNYISDPGRGLIDPYVIPSSQQLFDFVNYYIHYYKFGFGKNHPDAIRRVKNAVRVRFNIETKINPRAAFADRTVGPDAFARAVADVITRNRLPQRADIQSFDFRTLLAVQRQYPQIRTVYLFGDSPIFRDPSLPGSGDGTNLQDENGKNTPWFGGLYWPYSKTKSERPFRARQSGGFEGMALTSDGQKLLALLEGPLVGDDQKVLLINEFDLQTKTCTGKRYKYQLDSRGTNIGDFVMFNEQYGLIVERDGSQGNLNGFKAIYQIKLNGPEQLVDKKLVVDLLRINDPNGISLPGQPGDVGLGQIFAFPFTTIEDVFFIDSTHIGVLNDNNFPFSLGRHPGTGQPDDTEFIIIKLGQPLGN